MNGPLITGAILAGGRGTRMGGLDKGLVDFDGRPLIEHVLTRLRPQVDDIVIVANRNLARYYEYDLTVLSDDQPDYPGPLAGIESALSRATTPYVLVVPCDGPHLPHDLATRACEAFATTGAELAVAHDGVRLQPLFVLLHASLLPDLRRFLDDGGRSVREWYNRHAIAAVDFSDCADAFVNLNTPDDLAACSPRPSGEGPGVRVGTPVMSDTTTRPRLRAPSPQPLSRRARGFERDAV
ncbi:MAG TPA: molybdenum cofactor guanylyltransferase MobA [Gammaproteobacteria bacterium]|nr:molybdenum cofactor guanylyltransferase MobA [Gammaproteobacteria bacterium]